MIRFGPWSAMLGMAAGFGAVVAVLLVASPGNRAANRLLAGPAPSAPAPAGRC